MIFFIVYLPQKYLYFCMFLFKMGTVCKINFKEDMHFLFMEISHRKCTMLQWMTRYYHYNQQMSASKSTYWLFPLPNIVIFIYFAFGFIFRYYKITRTQNRKCYFKSLFSGQMQIYIKNTLSKFSSVLYSSSKTLHESHK